MENQLTEDMMRLLFLIDQYTGLDSADRLTWLKELPLTAIVYQGIVDRVFLSYDYAPWSVPMLDGTRQWLNVSREAKDDLEDLLNLHLLSVLRLSTSQFGYLTAYRLTNRGKETIEKIPRELKDSVLGLVSDQCSVPRLVSIRERKFYFSCQECGSESRIEVDYIEDIPYKSRPYLPSYLGIGELTGGEP